MGAGKWEAGVSTEALGGADASSSSGDALGNIDICERCGQENDCACGVCWACHSKAGADRAAATPEPSPPDGWIDYDPDAYHYKAPDTSHPYYHVDNHLFSDDAERAEREYRKRRRASLRRDLDQHA